MIALLRKWFVQKPKTYNPFKPLSKKQRKVYLDNFCHVLNEPTVQGHPATKELTYYKDGRFKCVQYKMAKSDNFGGPKWWIQYVPSIPGWEDFVTAVITDEVEEWMKRLNLPPVEQWTAREKTLFKLKWWQ